MGKMMYRRKLLRLRNCNIIIHGYEPLLDLYEYLGDNYAVVEVVGRPDMPENAWRDRVREAISVNGEEVTTLDEIPNLLKKRKLPTIEIMNEDASIYILYRDRVCKGYTDGGYAYLACIPLTVLTLLLIQKEVREPYW